MLEIPDLNRIIQWKAKEKDLEMDTWGLEYKILRGGGFMEGRQDGLTQGLEGLNLALPGLVSNGAVRRPDGAAGSCFVAEREKASGNVWAPTGDRLGGRQGFGEMAQGEVFVGIDSGGEAVQGLESGNDGGAFRIGRMPWRSLVKSFDRSRWSFRRFPRPFFQMGVEGESSLMGRKSAKRPTTRRSQGRPGEPSAHGTSTGNQPRSAIHGSETDTIVTVGLVQEGPAGQFPVPGVFSLETDEKES